MVKLQKQSDTTEKLAKENQNLKSAIMQMKSSAGFSQYQAYTGPITPLVEGYEKINMTREKFFITSDPDPSDSFKNEHESN